MLFPMWVQSLSLPDLAGGADLAGAAAASDTQVLPISIFLTMSGPPPSHQELQNAGKLVKFGLQGMRDFGRRGLRLGSCRDSLVNI